MKIIYKNNDVGSGVFGGPFVTIQETETTYELTILGNGKDTPKREHFEFGKFPHNLESNLNLFLRKEFSLFQESNKGKLYGLNFEALGARLVEILKAFFYLDKMEKPAPYAEFSKGRSILNATEFLENITMDNLPHALCRDLVGVLLDNGAKISLYREPAVQLDYTEFTKQLVSAESKREIELLQWLLNNQRIDLNKNNLQGSCASDFLDYAVAVPGANIKAIKMMIAGGAKFNNRNLFTLDKDAQIESYIKGKAEHEKIWTYARNDWHYLTQKERQEIMHYYIRFQMSNFTAKQSLASKDFGHDSITDEAAKAIAQWLSTMPSLTSLNFKYNEIGDAGVEDLAKALEDNVSITAVDLGHNRIGVDGCNSIAKMLVKNRVITSLSMSHNQMNAEMTIIIINALRIHTKLNSMRTILKSLDLSWNYIEASGAKDIADYIRWDNSLESLDISCSRVGDEGLEYIARALENNTTLKELKISGDLHYQGKKVGDRGMKALSKALKLNASITSIDLSFNDIGDEGLRYLMEALKENNSVKSINIRTNWRITDGAKKEFYNFIVQENYSLENLEMSGKIPKEVQSRLDQNKENNKIMPVTQKNNSLVKFEKCESGLQAVKCSLDENKGVNNQAQENKNENQKHKETVFANNSNAITLDDTLLWGKEFSQGMRKLNHEEFLNRYENLKLQDPSLKRGFSSLVKPSSQDDLLWEERKKNNFLSLGLRGLPKSPALISQYESIIKNSMSHKITKQDLTSTILKNLNKIKK